MTDWLTRIRSRNYPSDFIGEDPAIPKEGQRVLVLRGPHKGEEFDVVGVWGPAWTPTKQKVYVVLPGDQLSWLWPWDVEILGS